MANKRTSDLPASNFINDDDLITISTALGGGVFSSKSIEYSLLKTDILDSTISGDFVERSGDTMTGDLVMGANSITTSKTTFNNNELVTRLWVENNTGGGGGTIVGEGTQVGEIFAWPHDIDPSGALYCDGGSYDTTVEADLFAVIGYTYGGSGNNFNVPDYRGYVHRAMDDGAGIDPDASSRTDRGDGTTGDEVGTKQNDAFKSHTHQIRSSGNENDSGDATGNNDNFSGYLTTEATGGSETRPKNIYVKYYIRKTVIINNYEFLDLSGGTMTGNINMNNNKITTTATTFAGNELVSSDWVLANLPTQVDPVAPEGVKRFAEYVTGKGNCRYSDGLFYITNDDEMRFVGDNSDGRLGQNASNANFPGTNIWLPAGVNAKPVKIWNNAENNLFCLASNNKLYACGYNGRNELSVSGGPTYVYQMTKVNLPGIGNDVVKKVVFGDHASYTIGYLTEGGKFYTAGENSRGAIGNGTTTDTNLSGAYLSQTNVADAIAVGSYNGDHHCLSFHILKNDGTVWSVGWGDNGQMGNNTHVATNTNWVQSILPSSAVEIQGAGSDAKGTIVAKLSNNALYGWGDNNAGVLGVGDSSRRLIPVQLFGFGTCSDYWMHGGYPSMFVKNTSNQVWGAGYSDQGQLGTGSGASTNSTFAITNLSTSLNIQHMYGFGGWEAGATNTVAIANNGHIYITGDNSQGTCSIGVKGGDQLSFVHARCTFNNNQKNIKDPSDGYPMIMLDCVSGGGPILMVLSDRNEMYGCGNGRWRMFTRYGDDLIYLTKINIT